MALASSRRGVNKKHPYYHPKGSADGPGGENGRNRGTTVPVVFCLPRLWYYCRVMVYGVIRRQSGLRCLGNPKAHLLPASSVRNMCVSAQMIILHG